MNYLTELLAFYQWLEQYPISPLLQAYWHLLMYYNNKAAVLTDEHLWYWPVRFNVPNTTLMTRLGLKNRQALWTQRQTLIRAERITYTPDTGPRAGQYSLIPFDKGLAEISVLPETRHGPTLVWAQAVTQNRHNDQPYINKLNHKQTSLYCNNQDTAASIHGFNLLPPLTDDEKAAIKAQYPGDEVAAFYAMWEAREEKQKEGTT